MSRRRYRSGIQRRRRRERAAILRTVAAVSAVWLGLAFVIIATLA